ncbi:MAG: thiamine pyrophosphate-binding protein [Gammaproteobacteria bacterium]|jgi:thiamine pyrophosphate-dependent acetolactate synthase large subunit-like protein
MRELVTSYLSAAISRRDFISRLVALGVSATAAQSILHSVSNVAHGQTLDSNDLGYRLFEGTTGEALAEQLIASGVKYVFGNSASQDASFYEALVDRPQLKYLITPHEGPGAAMAAGYIKASGEPAIVMQAGVVGMTNAMGQMYNAWKEQIPLVFYSYTRPGTSAVGRDAFEEVPSQDDMVGPITKYRWTATRADKIPDTIRRAFKSSWTPAYGPSYVSWYMDFDGQKIRTEIIDQDKLDPNMRVRPNPTEVERAADLLINAERPLMIVGDEVYRAKAIPQAITLAETLGISVVQARQVHTNFPQNHPLWVGDLASVDRLTYPASPDVVINIGDKLQHSGARLIVPRNTRFIDMRLDAESIGMVLRTDVPIVADVAYGINDLQSAIEDRMTPDLRTIAKDRMVANISYRERADAQSALVSKNPYWNDSPMLSDRVTYEIAAFADKDAIIVDDAGSIGRSHSLIYDPINGRERFFYFGAHLGTGVGTAAGVQLARPGRQVICLVGDGTFIFGPTALWNMARLELPVITVVYNNHAYCGPHNRVISQYPGGRMAQTGKFVHDYLGKPDMNMASIAKGFGVQAEVVKNPRQLKMALGRARKASLDGKPYLIDAQVRRTGAGWSDDPWVPKIS